MASTKESLYTRNRSKTFWLYAMVAMYLGAGINHFINSGTYLPIMPPWLPFHLELIYISGTFEIFFGLLLLPLATRSIASLGTILLLIAIFPANIQMTINYYNEGNPYLWVTILRLPFQYVFIRWAYKFYKRPALIRPV